MACLPKAITESRAFSGNKTFGLDQRRNYLFIIMLDAAGTVEFGGGGGKIPLTISQFYEPYVAPTSEFTVETTGNFIVHTVASTFDDVT